MHSMGQVTIHNKYRLYIMEGQTRMGNFMLQSTPTFKYLNWDNYSDWVVFRFPQPLQEKAGIIH